jgi:hypothetical protein
MIAAVDIDGCIAFGIRGGGESEDEGNVNNEREGELFGFGDEHGRVREMWGDELRAFTKRCDLSKVFLAHARMDGR